MGFRTGWGGPRRAGERVNLECDLLAKYVEKLLGNLIGLGRLMAFVARETGMEVGPLTVVSTHAKIDQPGGAMRGEIKALLARFDQAIAPLAA